MEGVSGDSLMVNLCWSKFAIMAISKLLHVQSSPNFHWWSINWSLWSTQTWCWIWAVGFGYWKRLVFFFVQCSFDMHKWVIACSVFIKLGLIMHLVILTYLTSLDAESEMQGSDAGGFYLLASIHPTSDVWSILIQTCIKGRTLYV